MAEKVGELYYSVTLDTGEMIRGQRAVDREVGKTTDTLDRFQAKLTQVASAVAAYASAAYIIQRSDQYTKLTAQLKLATDGEAEFAKAMSQVKQIAAEAQTDLSGVAMLYARITTATKELGTSQADVAAITRTVALALKVSGAGAAESASATLQLSQAFASGVLRGEEFNAVNEAAPRLMKALADGIGVPVGQLRSMAEAGQLTSEVLANALPRALGELEQEAKQIQTISGAFQLLNNEVMLFIGQQTTASGAAKLTADAIGLVAQNLDLMAAAAIGFAAAKLAAVLIAVTSAAAAKTVALVESVAAQRAAIAASQASAAAAVAESAAKVENITLTQAMLTLSRQEMVAKLAATNQTLAQAAAQAAAAKSAGALSFALALLREAEATTAAAQAARAVILKELAVLGAQQAGVTAAMTAATAAHTAAQKANAAAMGATSAASTVASRALTLVGGPIGLITTLLGLGTTAWMLWGNSAKDESKKAADEVERSGQEIIDSLDRQNAKLRERLALAKAGQVAAAKGQGPAEDKLAKTLTEINALKEKGNTLTGAEQIQLAELQGRYRDLAGALETNRNLKGEIETAGQQSKKKTWLEKYATDAERVAAEVAKAKKELGAEFTPDMEQRIRQKIMPDKKPVKTADQKFDDEGYLSGLRKKQATEIGIINETEAEELRVAKKNLAEKRISQATYQQAVTTITATAEQDRAELMRKTQEDIDKGRLDAEKKVQQEIEDLKRNRQGARRDIAALDPLAAVRLEEEERLAIVEANRQLDLQNTQLYEDQKLAIQREASLQRQEILQREIDMQDRNNQTSLAAMSDLAGNVYSLLEKSGKERTALGKAAFLASKALAVAEILMSTEVAAAKAGAQLGIFGLPMAAVIRATGYASAGMVAGMAIGEVAGGRQYGGPVSAGSLYRVNETGQPEMFTGSNGSQYMMPTKSGQVTPANQVGGGGGWTININQAPPGTTATVNEQARTIDIAVGRAVGEVANQISSNTGPVWTAMRTASSVKGRM